MKKIGFVSSNKVFAQSLVTVIKNYLDSEFEIFALLNLHQAALDAEILKIDIAVIDMSTEFFKTQKILWSLCNSLHQSVPDCQILLLVPQEDKEICNMAIKSKENQVADDFVFVDSSLDYLLTKLIDLTKTQI